VSSRWLALALPLVVAGICAADDEDAVVEAAARKALARVSPSVVEVETIGAIPERHEGPKLGGKDGAPVPPDGKGLLVKEGFKQAFGPSTGIVVRKDGMIVTSTFVLEREPRHVFVTLDDGRALVAHPLGRDETRGLALLKVSANDLVPATCAGRDDAVVGRFSLAVGRGLGLPKPSVSIGIVSARDRAGGRAIQSSSAISPVNYGGPLVAIDGSVLGMIVPLAPAGGMAAPDLYDSGIGFAIPMQDVLELLPRLEKGERLEAGFLGIVVDPGSVRGGAKVQQVAPGSPAAKSTMFKPGALIVEVDGKKIEGHLDLQRALARHYAGDFVKMVVITDHGEGRLEFEIKLAPRPKPQPEEGAAPPHGEGDKPPEEPR
jgi:serine protease Do